MAPLGIEAAREVSTGVFFASVVLAVAVIGGAVIVNGGVSDAVERLTDHSHLLAELHAAEARVADLEARAVEAGRMCASAGRSVELLLEGQR